MPWAHPSKSFKFTGLAHDQTNLISFRVDLGETPTYMLLQQLFYDLYRDGRYTPQYLFMAAKDIAVLRNEVFETVSQGSSYSMRILAMENVMGDEFLSMATSCIARIVPLPDLEQGSVIVGFFR
jgi:hypothetical protein